MQLAEYAMCETKLAGITPSFFGGFLKLHALTFWPLGGSKDKL